MKLLGTRYYDGVQSADIQVNAGTSLEQTRTPSSSETVTASVALEDAFDFHADLLVGRLQGSGGGGV